MCGMPARSIALLVLVTAVWGVNFVVLHVGLEHFPPLLFNALRFTFMALPAVFRVGLPRVPWKRGLGSGFVPSVVNFSLVFVSTAHAMAAGRSSLLRRLQVIFAIALAGFVRPERPRRQPIAGASVALAGLALIGIDGAARARIVPCRL